MENKTWCSVFTIFLNFNMLKCKKISDPDSDFLINREEAGRRKYSWMKEALLKTVGSLQIKWDIDFQVNNSENCHNSIFQWDFGIDSKGIYTN